MPPPILTRESEPHVRAPGQALSTRHSELFQETSIFRKQHGGGVCVSWKTKVLQMRRRFLVCFCPVSGRPVTEETLYTLGRPVSKNPAHEEVWGMLAWKEERWAERQLSRQSACLTLCEALGSDPGTTWEHHEAPGEVQELLEHRCGVCPALFILSFSLFPPALHAPAQPHHLTGYTQCFLSGSFTEEPRMLAGDGAAGPTCRLPPRHSRCSVPARPRNGRASQTTAPSSLLIHRILSLKWA